MTLHVAGRNPWKGMRRLDVSADNIHGNPIEINSPGKALCFRLCLFSLSLSLSLSLWIKSHNLSELKKGLWNRKWREISPGGVIERAGATDLFEVSLLVTVTLSGLIMRSNRDSNSTPLREDTTALHWFSLSLSLSLSFHLLNYPSLNDITSAFKGWLLMVARISILSSEQGQERTFRK